MRKIAFIHGHRFQEELHYPAISERLQRFLINLRSNAGSKDDISRGDIGGEKLVDEFFDQLSLEEPRSAGLPKLTANDLNKITRRAKKIQAKRSAQSRVPQMKREDREALEVFKNGVQLVSVSSEARADVIASILHEEMPWMAPATERVWHEMRRSVRSGEQGLRLRPLLLDGPPGIGKSHWARLLGDLVGVPSTVVEATSENASFGIVGTQKGWGSSHPGRLIQTVMTHLVANPLIIIDEIEKSGNPTSSSGTTFNLPQALLPLFEPLTSAAWPCPYFQLKFDMSWVTWVLTSNKAALLPAPLLSRCPPLRLGPLTVDDLNGFARQQGMKRKLPDEGVAAIAEVIGALGDDAARLSLRSVLRMLDELEMCLQRPILH